MKSRSRTTTKRSAQDWPRIPIHPGEILLEEYLKPMNMSQAAFARHLEITLSRLNEIVKGKRGISGETAILFGKALGTGPEIWMNLQTMYDLATAHEDWKRSGRKVKALPQSDATP